jgi:hypothetical protein
MLILTFYHVTVACCDPSFGCINLICRSDEMAAAMLTLQILGVGNTYERRRGVHSRFLLVFLFARYCNR